MIPCDHVLVGTEGHHGCYGRKTRYFARIHFCWLAAMNHLHEMSMERLVAEAFLEEEEVVVGHISMVLDNLQLDTVT